MISHGWQRIDKMVTEECSQWQNPHRIPTLVTFLTGCSDLLQGLLHYMILQNKYKYNMIDHILMYIYILNIYMCVCVQRQSNCFMGLPWWIASWDEPGISEACARHHLRERPRAKANSDTHLWAFLHCGEGNAAQILNETNPVQL